MHGVIKHISRLCAGLMLLGAVSYAGGEQVLASPVQSGQVIGTGEAALAAVDVSSSITVLGSPFKKAAYARNVWDMQLFGGKIYLGHGNSSNNAPSPNAGPVQSITGILPRINSLCRMLRIRTRRQAR